MIDSLSVVVPAFEEERRLPETLAGLVPYVQEHFATTEIIVVDDGSADRTAEVAREFGPPVRVIQRPHAGKGAAVRCGVLDARNDWILIMDADMAIPIEELERFTARAAEYPIVIGSKRLPASDVKYPALRRLGSTLGQLWIRLLVVRGFEDTQCGFKLLRRDVGQRLFAVQRLNGFGFDFELLHLAQRYRIPVCELPVRCRHIAGGSVRIRAYLRTFGEAIAVRWNRIRGRYPATLPGQ